MKSKSFQSYHFPWAPSTADELCSCSSHPHSPSRGNPTGRHCRTQPRLLREAEPFSLPPAQCSNSPLPPHVHKRPQAPRKKVAACPEPSLRDSQIPAAALPWRSRWPKRTACLCLPGTGPAECSTDRAAEPDTVHPQHCSQGDESGQHRSLGQRPSSRGLVSRPEFQRPVLQALGKPDRDLHHCNTSPKPGRIGVSSV